MYQRGRGMDSKIGTGWPHLPLLSPGNFNSDFIFAPPPENEKNNSCTGGGGFTLEMSLACRRRRAPSPLSPNKHHRIFAWRGSEGWRKGTRKKSLSIPDGGFAGFFRPLTFPWQDTNTQNVISRFDFRFKSSALT